MTKGRKTGPKTPEGMAKSLANLRQFLPDGPREREYHGVTSIRFAQPQTRDLAEEIRNALQDDGAVWIGESDFIQIQLLALCLRRIGQADKYLDQVNTLTNKKGEVRPVLDLLVKLLREAQSLADSLGLTPRSRVNLGIDLLKGQSLAALMARAQAPKGRGTAEKVEAEAEPVQAVQPGAQPTPKSEEASQ